ncbi:MAG: outer membrane protein assembly factor BamA [Rhodospirillales bacterium]|nr:outer membrane protein assembly factor BamA [Rhodospirillales bacterium]
MAAPLARAQTAGVAAPPAGDTAAPPISGPAQPVRAVPSASVPTPANASPAPAQAPASGAAASAVPVVALAPPPSPGPAFVPPPLPPGTGTVAAIKVEGNQRIEASTIENYMLLRVGDPFDPAAMDRSLKTLYATGLFSDVRLTREGNTLVVRVQENPIINRVVIEGNHQLTSKVLLPELEEQPRGVFTQAAAAKDRQRILDLYARRGYYATTVDPKIIKRGQNRVDVVFEVHDGAAAYIGRIAFVGNHAFSESRLRNIIGSRQEVWWNVFTNADIVNPQRLAADREALRRFYLHNGYAQVDILPPTAELSPDRKSFFVTFTIHEGPRYRVSSVKVDTTLPHTDAKSLQSEIGIAPGAWYDGDTVEKASQALTATLQNRGYSFVNVKPQVKRDDAKHTIALVFDVGEGPHVYIGRINITGNQRTQDEVIRREFRVAEGDPMNAALLRLTQQRLHDLNFFNNVTITPQPTNEPDKVDLNVNVAERATGQLTVGGGYSTDIGALADIGLSEANFIGTGINASINAIIAQKEISTDVSVTNPYFLGRNILAGIDVFNVMQNLQSIAEYDERRTGFSLTAGYNFSDHLRQSWNYTLAYRDVYNVQSSASLYVQSEAGGSTISQLGQVLTIDYRDSTLDPRKGYVARLSTDFAGLGGSVDYVRAKIDGSYYIPLESIFGDRDYGLAISAGTGYLFNLGGRSRIIDNFFLGGANLRGFQTGGVGPHALTGYNDSLGGRFIWTQSTEFRFPLPVSRDLGLRGRVFVDIGSLSGVDRLLVNGVPVAHTNYATPRVGAGFGISWNTPFGLINLDFAEPVVKEPYDQTQFFRFGFGTRF